jgi:pilus assembly protein CpaB
VRTNDVVGVSGFATPGMRVDVLIFGIVPASPPNEGTRARTLLQNIQVLSAGQEIQKTADGKPLPVQVVNLLVSPQQAEVLSLASNDARIQLVLRNPMDAANAETAGTSLGELLSGTRSSQPVQRRNAAPPVIKVSAPPRPAPVVVEVILGTHRDFEKFGEKTPEPPANPSGGPPPMPISVQSLQQNTSQAMSQLLTHAGQASLAGAQPANSLAGAPRQ